MHTRRNIWKRYTEAALWSAVQGDAWLPEIEKTPDPRDDTATRDQQKLALRLCRQVVAGEMNINDALAELRKAGITPAHSDEEVL